MLKKKITFVLLGAILLGFFIYFMIDEQRVKESSSINPVTSKEKAKDKANTEQDKEKIPTGPFGKYEYDGKQCLDITAIIERGDCFQEVFEEHLQWYVNEEKVNFYFPFQREQSHWQDVLYFEIDDNDQLKGPLETDYFDEYIDPYPYNDTNHDRGITIINEYWHIFSNLIPKESRETLKYVHWTDTGDDHVFAVGRKDGELEAEILLLGHQLSSYKPYHRHSLLHEYGHMLTLNKTQVDINEETYNNDNEPTEEQLKQDEDNCKTLYHLGRCAYEDSYIYDYYQQFWEDIYDEYKEIDWDHEKEYEEFFFKHEDRFFNSYQGTSPLEDIADAFSFFVLTHSDFKDQPEVKYQKVNFFYEHEELVELRTKILENLYHLTIEDEEFY